MLQQSHKHWCEAAVEKLDCLRKSGDSRVSGCTRLVILPESEKYIWIIRNVHEKSWLHETRGDIISAIYMYIC